MNFKKVVFFCAFMSIAFGVVDSCHGMDFLNNVFGGGDENGQKQKNQQQISKSEKKNEKIEKKKEKNKEIVIENQNQQPIVNNKIEEKIEKKENESGFFNNIGNVLNKGKGFLEQGNNILQGGRDFIKKTGELAFGEEEKEEPELKEAGAMLERASILLKIKTIKKQATVFGEGLNRIGKVGNTLLDQGKQQLKGAIINKVTNVMGINEENPMNQEIKNKIDDVDNGLGKQINNIKEGVGNIATNLMHDVEKENIEGNIQYIKQESDRLVRIENHLNNAEHILNKEENELKEQGQQVFLLQQGNEKIEKMKKINEKVKNNKKMIQEFQKLKNSYKNQQENFDLEKVVNKKLIEVGTLTIEKDIQKEVFNLNQEKIKMENDQKILQQTLQNQKEIEEKKLEEKGKEIVALQVAENGRVIAKKELKDKKALEEKRIEENNKTLKELEQKKWDEFAKYFTKEKLILYAAILVIAILVVVLVFFAIKLGYNYVDRLLRIPTIVKDTSLKSGLAALFELPGFKTIKKLLFKPAKIDNDLTWFKKEYVYPAVVKEQIENFLYQTIQRKMLKRVNNNRAGEFNYEHLILFGLPGVGKTYLAKALAKKLDMDYALIKGGEVRACQLSDAVNQIRDLCARAMRSEKGTVIFIDEFDSCGKSRTQTTDQFSRQFLSVLLSLIEECSENVLFVFATNLEKEIDNAIKSRCGTIINVLPPAAIERKQLFDLYIQKHILDKPGFIVEEASGQERRVKISLDKDIIDEYITALAQRLDGFVGRDIDAVLKRLSVVASKTTDYLVTKGMFERAIDAYVMSKAAISDSQSTHELPSSMQLQGALV